jgi:Contractile injection system tube protein
MGLKTPLKLEKLTISAYKDSARSEKVEQSPFIAMFNPETYSEQYFIEYSKKKAPISGLVIPKYVVNQPSTLSFKLLLDGTGSHEVRMPLLQHDTNIESRIKRLLNICFYINGDIHEANYLKVSWGKMNFNCRLSNLGINYTSFNPDGTPLRAELNIEFISDEKAEKQMALDDMKSPDLTHSRIVKNGDTLPLLCKSVYGSTDHYLWIAEQNQLDDFRNLIPGQRLSFPPLVS